MFLLQRKPGVTHLCFSSTSEYACPDCCRIFPISRRPRSERLKIQVWDKDILEADDAIAEGYLDLQPAFRQALRTQARAGGSDGRAGE